MKRVLYPPVRNHPSTAKKYAERRVFISAIVGKHGKVS
jgi:hypothetical protein